MGGKKERNANGLALDGVVAAMPRLAGCGWTETVKIGSVQPSLPPRLGSHLINWQGSHGALPAQALHATFHLGLARSLLRCWSSLMGAAPVPEKLQG